MTFAFEPEPSVWRLLPADGAPMGHQLARSEALLAGVAESGRPALRWYNPAVPALVLGNGQQANVADLAACHARGVTVYRRASGGTAVLTDEQALSMEVALPPTHPLATGDIVRGYRWLGEIWAQALNALGIAAARALPTEEQRALPPLAKDDLLRAACYGTLSPWEVVVGTRKVVGLCQVRRRTGVLHQVGVHLRWRPEALVALLALSDAARAALLPRLSDAAAGLDTLAGHAVPVDDVRRAVEHALTERLGVRLEPSPWTAAELATAERVEAERFQPLA